MDWSLLDYLYLTDSETENQISFINIPAILALLILVLFFIYLNSNAIFECFITILWKLVDMVAGDFRTFVENLEWWPDTLWKHSSCPDKRFWIEPDLNDEGIDIDEYLKNEARKRKPTKLEVLTRRNTEFNRDVGKISLDPWDLLGSKVFLSEGKQDIKIDEDKRVTNQNSDTSVVTIGPHLRNCESTKLIIAEPSLEWDSTQYGSTTSLLSPFSCSPPNMHAKVEKHVTYKLETNEIGKKYE